MAANSPLMQLGPFQFSLLNGVHTNLTRKLEWRWPEQARILRKPALQFTGPQADVITLEGVIYPSHSGRQSTIDDLKEMASSGEPYMLTDGLGRVYGEQVIRRIEEKRSLFMDTNAARRIEFTIELAEYGPDNPGDRANPLSSTRLSGYAQQALQGAAFAPENVGPGSPAAALDWTGSADFLANLNLAREAGFTPGDVAFIGSQVETANRDGALDAVGAMGTTQVMTPGQQAGWNLAGLNPSEMLSQMGAGNGPTVSGIALGQLQTLDSDVLGSVIDTVTTSSQSGFAMNDLVRAAGTLVPGLDFDPQITSQLRGLLLN